MAELTQNVGFQTTTRVTATAFVNKRIAAITGALKRATRHMQHARMMSMLAQMDADQLREIGISRADIPTHAAKLVGLD